VRNGGREEGMVGIEGAEKANDGRDGTGSVGVALPLELGVKRPCACVVCDCLSCYSYLKTP